jgi:prepilin-type N-terminal cleavage/methylation domain-containing protein
MRVESRRGFTLIELMVAMALTLFIMVILSQAFIASLDTFSGLKGIADMQANLRAAEVLLRDDLSQDHFEGKRRLSSQTTANSTPDLAARHPQAGFFALRRFNNNLPTTEGTDGFGIISQRCVDCMIYMTVKRKGNRQENFFNTALQGAPADLNKFFNQTTAYDIPGTELPFSTQTQKYAGGPTGFYSSQWAEVMYFLVRTGSTEQPNDPTSTLGTKTYGLYRAQFVMVPDGTKVSEIFTSTTPADITKLSETTFAGMSCGPVTDTTVKPNVTKLKFFSPADAAQQGVGQRVIPASTWAAFLPAFNPATNSRVMSNATLVCPNVISFHAQIMPVGTFLAKSFSDSIIDTALAPTGLWGIQVTLRVWDHKTRQTRQATVIQDL